jgi:type I restriction enzyme S subunit
MRSSPLLSRFDLIVDDASNIQRLRKLIVHLAISGRLLDDPSDEIPTRELLKGITSKKQVLIKGGRAKKQVALSPIDECELPTGLQNVDRFERLENIAILEKGLTAIQRAKPGDYPLVTTGKDRSSCDHYDFDGRAVIIPMVSSTGHGDASLKRLHYQEGKFALGNILCAAFPFSSELISARFIFEYLTAFKEELLVSRMIGTANVSLTLGKIGEVPVPLVSAAAQRRVDELMALCDRFEEAQQEQERTRSRLVEAVLSRLNSGVNGEALRGHAHFYFNHLPRLTSRPEYIQGLRKTVLNLAVRGQLVPQNSSDEPASLLLQRLGKEIETYTSEQKIAPPRPEPIGEQDIPHPAPNGWIWTRLCCLFRVVTDGDHQPPPKSEDGVAFLTIGNITTGSLDFSNCRFVPRSYLESVAPYRKPSYGDILYTVVGATYGRPALVDTKRPFCVQRHIAILKPASMIDTKFLCLLLASPLVYEQATRSTTGAAQPTIALRPLRNFLVPLPPLAEQHRIVAKVDELMVVCDRLEEQLTAVQTESSLLLEAVLAHALNGSFRERYDDDTSAIMNVDTPV